MDAPVVAVVAHAPTEVGERVRDAVRAGVTDPDVAAAAEEAGRGAPQLRDVEALTGDADEVRDAAAVLLVTPVNLGYISGALKHFFDRNFEALEGTMDGRPYALVVKGRSDGTGAIRAAEAIATGLSWRRARPPLELLGELTDDDLAACHELAATITLEIALT